MYVWTHAGIAKQKKFIAEESHTGTDTQLPTPAAGVSRDISRTLGELQ